MATTVELDTRAEALYEKEAGWREFAEAFTVEELNVLAGLCQMTPENNWVGRGYDDEVFDALYFVGAEA